MEEWLNVLVVAINGIKNQAQKKKYYSPQVPSSKNDTKQTQNIKNKDVEENQKNEIKNLPSTVVKRKIK